MPNDVRTLMIGWKTEFFSFLFSIHIGIVDCPEEFVYLVLPSFSPYWKDFVALHNRFRPGETIFLKIDLNDFFVCFVCFFLI